MDGIPVAMAMETVLEVARAAVACPTSTNVDRLRSAIDEHDRIYAGGEP